MSFHTSPLLAFLASAPLAKLSAVEAPAASLGAAWAALVVALALLEVTVAKVAPAASSQAASLGAARATLVVALASLTTETASVAE